MDPPVILLLLRSFSIREIPPLLRSSLLPKAELPPLFLHRASQSLDPLAVACRTPSGLSWNSPRRGRSLSSPQAWRLLDFTAAGCLQATPRECALQISSFLGYLWLDLHNSQTLPMHLEWIQIYNYCEKARIFLIFSSFHLSLY
ncbi:hypothetical protein SEVIR_7G058600v4 [Setaria viridis]|uniref:Uncharacterized protein n=2 Tax=Setaria TaxID=4554 RepID=A0A368RS95_SETIT|nr:hypothetical protein SETIT_7G052800v2 [Setaria italica]TKW03699.1 hypothetical protein SEVIR_7G058600v2 [Setaria viridis]